MSNASAANELLAFKQARSGSLVPLASYSTGGRGSGAGLGNQGAVVSDGEHIFVVNAGSDDLSVSVSEDSDYDSSTRYRPAECAQ